LNEFWEGDREFGEFPSSGESSAADAAGEPKDGWLAACNFSKAFATCMGVTVWAAAASSTLMAVMAV
jgi:hypothetical protein